MATKQRSDTPPERSGVRAGKRASITQAARDVFGRDGYARTSIDAIAAEAGVSTRTIYNHFAGKEQLFSAVLHDSATQVADEFTAAVQQTVGGIDLRSDLLALGRAFASQGVKHPEHFAMVGQIQTERPHFPADVIDAWQQAGPLRVHNELARRFAALAERGLLRVGDPERAAIHFSVLVTAGIPKRALAGAASPSAEQIDETVRAGVDAFLNGYGAR